MNWEENLSRIEAAECPFCGELIREDQTPIVIRAHGHLFFAHNACAEKEIKDTSVEGELEK